MQASYQENTGVSNMSLNPKRRKAPKAKPKTSTKTQTFNIDEHFVKSAYKAKSFGDPSFRTLLFLSKPGVAEAHGWTREEINRMKQETWNEYVQPDIKDHIMFEGEPTKPQKVFHKVVQEFITEQVKLSRNSDMQLAKDYPDEFKPPTKDDEAEDRYNTSVSLPYHFHTPKTVSVDSALYSITHDGHADYGWGSSLYGKLDSELKKIGYYYEPVGGGDLNFAKR
jgi:hypothetical protein